MCIKKIKNEITIGDLLSAINTDGQEKLLASASIDVLFTDEALFASTYDKNILLKYFKEYDCWNNSKIKYIDYELKIALFEEETSKYLIRIAKSYDFNQKLRSGKKLSDSLVVLNTGLTTTKLYISREDINDYIFDEEDLTLMSSWDERIKNAVDSLRVKPVESGSSERG